MLVPMGCCMRAAWAREEGATLQGFEDNSVLSRTHLRNRAVSHDRAAHRSRPAAMLLGVGMCGAGYNGAEHGSVTIPVFRVVQGSVAGDFPHVKVLGDTAQITTQGHMRTFFRVVFRYLVIAALSLSGSLDHGKTTLMRRSLSRRYTPAERRAHQRMSE